MTSMIIGTAALVAALAAAPSAGADVSPVQQGAVSSQSALMQGSLDRSNGAALTSPIMPGDVGTQAWDCPDDFSCYYDGTNGTNRMWIAPSCGFFNLGGMGLNDRLSSMWNRGHGAVDLYNWDGVSSWVYLTTVPIGAAVNMGSIDNIVDGVGVRC